MLKLITSTKVKWHLFLDVGVSLNRLKNKIPGLLEKKHWNY